MAVLHTDFLSSARSMVKVDDVSEILCRNSGSRAYYALYHKAKDVLHTRGLGLMRVENSGSHEALISTVAAQGQKGKMLAAALDKFKKFRHNCDYDLSMSISDTKLNFYLAEAERLMDMMDRLEPPKGN